MGFASRVLRIRQGEGRVTALVVALSLVSMASLAIGESGISALFFERVGADSLPLAYLLQGATTFVVMLALTGALARVEHRLAYVSAPLALAAVVLAERAVLETGAGWIYMAMWITVAVTTLVLGVAVWGTAGVVVDTRQAKRLFPLFAGGGILGAVAGGVVTQPLAAAIGAENLLLVWIAGLLAAFALSRLILGPGRRGAARRRVDRGASPIRELGSAFAFVRRSRLLVWMTLAAVLFSVLFYSLYLPYARAAAERFPNADDLAGFFGLFWAGVTGAAFLVSMFAANRLFAWFGVAAMVVVLPVLYSGAFGVLLGASSFTTLVAVRFVMGTWLQGVASPAWEALTNVVPESRRDQTRAFLNGGPTQVGTIIAGVVALVGETALTPRQFAAIGLIGAVATVVTTIGIRRSYAGALVDALRTGRPQVFESPSARAITGPLAIDADAARILAQAMQSHDVRERRLAFQLVVDLPPAVRPDTVSGLKDEDPIVRLTAARAVDLSSRDGRDSLVTLIDDGDPAVAAAAAVRALSLGEDARSASRLRELLADPDDGARRAAVEQLELAPLGRTTELTIPLLADPSAEVRSAALHTLARASPEQAVERVVAALRDADPIVRRAAGRTLGSIDAQGFAQVLAALDDPRTADGAIEAVRRMESGHEHEIRAFIEEMAARSTADRELAGAIPDADEATRLLRESVLDRGRQVARSGLWAATLLAHRREEMETAIENLDAGPGQLATALETLESAVDPALVRPFISLWELPAAGRRDDWLSRALDDDDAFIRGCAEFVRAELEGGLVAGSVASISTIERVLFLRKVSLFADLAPADLERVAQHAEERGYADGEVIAAEGELGEDLHIVVDGTIRVVQGAEGTERELARRAAGDVVGEMSLITRTPRMATLIALGPVRTIRLRHREFESMLRERPSIGMAVMRVLAHRLAERGLESTA